MRCALAASGMREAADVVKLVYLTAGLGRVSEIRSKFLASGFVERWVS